MGVGLSCGIGFVFGTSEVDIPNTGDTRPMLRINSGSSLYQVESASFHHVEKVKII